MPKRHKRLPIRKALALQRARKELGLKLPSSDKGVDANDKDYEPTEDEKEFGNSDSESESESEYEPTSTDDEEESEEDNVKANSKEDRPLTNIKVILTDLGLKTYLASTVGGKMVTYLTLHRCIPFNYLNYKSTSVITTLISRVALFLKNNFDLLPSEETLVDIC